MKHIQIRNSDMAWHILPIIWEKFHEKCTDSWCWRSIARHVINQLADKQTIKQTSSVLCAVRFIKLIKVN